MGEFGKFLKEKRIERNISVREMAKFLGISISYISELETGNKLPPNSSKEKYGDLIEKIISYLNLSDNEAKRLHDLADSELGSKGYLSNDIADYINKVPEAMVALRKAKDANLSDKQWSDIINNINKANRR